LPVRHPSDEVSYGLAVPKICPELEPQSGFFRERVRGNARFGLEDLFDFLQHGPESNVFLEVFRMAKTIWTVAALGVIAILVTVAPDIRRYLRMRSM
jgi:hypothetical protein